MCLFASNFVALIYTLNTKFSLCSLEHAYLYARRKYVVQGFHQIFYQGGVLSKVSLVFEDFKFKISEG